ICCKAMALHPKARYAMALDLAADVERWLADEPVQAYREKFTDQATRWMKKHRSGVTNSVASVLLIAHREAEELRDKMQPPRDNGRGRDIRCKYYTKLSESKHWEGHILRPQRKRILRMALEMYQEFMQEEREKQLVTLANLGRPSRRLANVYQAECGRA